MTIRKSMFANLKHQLGLALFDEAPEPMCVLNLSTEILATNKAFVQEFGDSSSKTNMEDLLQEESTNLLPYLKNCGTEKPHTFEMNLQTLKSGNRLMRLSVRKMVLPADERESVLIVVLSDITDSNNAQIALIHEFAFFSELEELGREINGQINLTQMISRTLDCSVLHCQLSEAVVVYNHFETEELTEGISTLRSTVGNKELIKILCKDGSPIQTIKTHLTKNPSKKTPCFFVNYDDWDEERDQQFLRSNQVTEMIAVPIRIGAEVMGFLIGAKPGAKMESLDIQARIQHLANLLSSALSNALLFHQLRLKNMELGTSLKELKRAENHRDQFYRFLIHDLNKPLASIIGTAGRLLTRYQHEEQVEQRLSRITRSALRLREYIADMLDFERIRRGDIDLKFASVNLRSEFLELGTMILDRYPQHSIQLNGLTHQEWEQLPELEFHTDIKQFNRILFNLMDNACKYGEGSVELNFQLQGNELLISIWNNGLSIPVNERAKIFEEFYRRDKQQETEGSGIGLASVRCLVQALSGSIFVDAPAKGGNLFSLRFPNDQRIDAASNEVTER